MERKMSLEVNRINEASNKWGEAKVAKVFKELMTRGRKDAFRYFEQKEDYAGLACLVYLTQGKRDYPS
jgi:hypothetical protein